MAGADAYAGLMKAQKLTSFRNKWPFGRSVRDRGTECTVHRAENSRRREVAKPGIALGSGPRDRGFESRLPDHSHRPGGCPSATAALTLRVGRSRRAGPPRPPSKSAPRRRRASSGCTPDALLLLHDPESLARTSDRLGAEYARVPQHDGLERPCSFCTAVPTKRPSRAAASSSTTRPARRTRR
jgi:hypothetical protein